MVEHGAIDGRPQIPVSAGEAVCRDMNQSGGRAHRTPALMPERIAG
jgi:hypothetical protein